MKKNKGILVYALIGLIFFALFSLNLRNDREKTLNLELSSSTENTREWLPGLSLGKGTYKIGLVVNTNDSGTINQVEFYTIDEGVILTSEISSGEYSTWYDIELENSSNILYLRTVLEDENAVDLSQIVVVSQDGLLYTDTYLFLLIFALAWFAFGWFYFRGDGLNSRSCVTVLILGSVAFVSYFLYKSYLISGHDIRFHLYRIEGIKDGLLSGQFPVRLHPTFNYGYGYATSTLYPELFLYVPAILRILGVSIPTAYQVFLFLINLVTAWVMYISVKSMTGSRYCACLGSVTYTLAVYRLVCLYERSAIGEALGLCFIPLVIAGFYHVFLGDQKKWYILMIGAVLVFQTHLISTLLTAAIAIIFGIIYLPRLFKDGRWKSLLKVLVGTGLLSLWYLIPLMDFYRLDLRLHTVESYSMYENAVYPAQLLNLFSKGTGMSYDLSAGIRGEMTMTVGVLVGLCCVFCAVYYIWNRKEKKGFDFSLFVLGLAATVAVTTWFPWNQLMEWKYIGKIVSIIQFPWRFLGYISVVFIMAAVLIVPGFLQKAGVRWKPVILGVVLAVGAFGVLDYGNNLTNAEVWLEKVEAIPESGANGATNEYLLNGTDFSRFIPGNYVLSDESVTLVETKKNGTNVEITYTGADGEIWIEVPLLWYPGYRAVDQDGKELPLERGEGSYLRVYTQGRPEATIYISYEGKTIYRVGDVISLGTLVVMAGWTVLGKKKVLRR